MSHSLIRLSSWLFIIHIFVLLTVISAAAQTKPTKVLLLNSYHKGFPWTDNIVSGIESALKPEENNIDLSVEYMDTKSMGFGEDYKQILYELYRHKYHDDTFDILISSDDNAFNFLREYREQLFSGAPVVFCGVNNRDVPNIIDSTMFTGVLESTAHEQTIDLILKLHPHTKKIFLVIDTTPSGQYRWGVTSPSFSQYPEIDFIRLTDEHSIEEIENIVSSLDEESAVIFFTLYRDKTGNYLSVREGATRITSASTRPVYTTHQLELPYGVVGGKVLGGFVHGEFAAGMAHRILNGEPVSSIPVVEKSPTRYVFNYDQLEKWDIALSSLPEDSIILNRPVSFYEENRFLVWAVLTAIIALIGIIFVLQINIIHRKRAVAEAVKRRAEFEAIFNSISDGIAFVDPQRKILRINWAFTQMFGYQLEEVAGQTPRLIYADPDDYEKQGQQRFNPGARIDQPIFENEYRRKDGTTFYGETLGAHVTDESGKLLGYIGVIHDVTERKLAQKHRRKLEYDLAQSQKMEAVGTLAGGIAHDFNNILSAILGYTELALLNPNCDPQTRENLEQVLVSSKRARDLVKQILLYSRKDGESRKPVCLASIVSETTGLLKSTIPRSVCFILEINEQSGQVLANATQLHQVIMNLGTNAYHALPRETGSIEIRLHPVEIDKTAAAKYPDLTAGRYAQLIVSDTGNGMSPEVMERIFDPFFTTKAQGQGTGMGLSVVHGIIHSLGGAIWADSQIGKGTTMNVLLPLFDGNFGASLSDQGSTDISGGNENILFVDDEPMITELAKKQLEGLGYQVTVFTSPIKAMNLFSSAPEAFDLIITDQTMPGMMGDVLAKNALLVRPDIPIIICTGHSTLLDADKVKAVGVKALLMKPVEGNVLAMEIRKIMDKKELSVS